MQDDARHRLLFPKLTQSQLKELAPYGEEIDLQEGEQLFAEHILLDHFYVILTGVLRITKQVGSEQVTLAIHYPGEFTGELSLLAGSTSIASAHASEPSRVLKITAENFRQLIVTCSPVTSVILTAMAYRIRDAENISVQHEKLISLGKMAAGLAHELNNPASAASRASGQLQQALQALPSLTLQLAEMPLTAQQRAFLTDFQQQGASHLRSTRASLDPLQQSDREEELTAILEGYGVTNAWELAPSLVEAGLDGEKLATFIRQAGTEGLHEKLTWLAATLQTTDLLNTIQYSTTRVSDLVKAVKAYSYMDQAPQQEIDIHDGLENTLTIMGYKLKQIEVIREYDRTLPRLNAYGSELNQVWTNLIDNAIDALKERTDPFQPRIRIRTFQQNRQIVVEVADNGSGIPAAIQSRIFEPFFTTKGVSQGSGIGLDVTYRIITERHKGSIKVSSVPGDTRFQVFLPLA